MKKLWISILADGKQISACTHLLFGGCRSAAHKKECRIPDNTFLNFMICEKSALCSSVKDFYISDTAQRPQKMAIVYGQIWNI